MVGCWSEEATLAAIRVPADTVPCPDCGGKVERNAHVDCWAGFVPDYSKHCFRCRGYGKLDTRVGEKQLRRELELERAAHQSMQAEVNELKDLLSIEWGCIPINNPTLAQYVRSYVEATRIGCIAIGEANVRAELEDARETNKRLNRRISKLEGVAAKLTSRKNDVAAARAGTVRDYERRLMWAHHKARHWREMYRECVDVLRAAKVPDIHPGTTMKTGYLNILVARIIEQRDALQEQVRQVALALWPNNYPSQLQDVTIVEVVGEIRGQQATSVDYEMRARVAEAKLSSAPVY